MYATNGFQTIARDVITALARIGLGAIFIAHGWQKLNEWTIAGTTEAFTQMGVPMPEIAAPFSTYVELIGGGLLVLGALTPVVGLLLAADLLGALVIVHSIPTPFVAQGGWELVVALAAGALLLAAMGPGRLSLDRLFYARKSTTHEQGTAEPRSLANA